MGMWKMVVYEMLKQLEQCGSQLYVTLQQKLLRVLSHLFLTYQRWARDHVT